MKLVLLDRDGVLNIDRSDYVKSSNEWEPCQGVFEALARLTRHGYKLVVASNQAGVAKGVIDIDQLNQVHLKMVAHANGEGAVIDAVFFCPHQDSDDCDCRKPKPGLLDEIRRRYCLDSLAGIPFLGDSLRDLQAAEQAGAEPHLLLSGHGRKTSHQRLPIGTKIHETMANFVSEQLAHSD